MANEPPGCLGFLFALFATGSNNQRQQETDFPYRQRDAFLSPAELNFFHVLKSACGEHFHICSKVRISDLLYVVNRNKNIGHANKIDRKHVDFVLCDSKTMQPKLVVELDDSSHNRKDRQDRDAFVDRAFAAAGLPILHLICRQSYRANELVEQIRGAIGITDAAPPLPPPLTSKPLSEASGSAVPVTTGTVPICPKCNVSMVERKSTRGKHQGKRFWACPSFPDCRNIVAID